MGHLRAGAILAAFLVLTLPLMPVQALLLRLAPSAARRLPHWYHRQVCRLVGVHVRVRGAPLSPGPVLLAANHTSWLDIPVLSSVAPVAFVAKREVAGWPLIGTLARLQRTVLVDRTRRHAVADTTRTLTARLAAGDAIVLFAEGTSSDGNQVLPFLSSLFAPALAPVDTEQPVTVQPLAIAYVAHHGLPLARHERPAIGWYGDMEMTRHAWALLKRGPIEVEVRLGVPLPRAAHADRKALSSAAETAVRALLVATLRGVDATGVADVVPGGHRVRAGPRVRSRGSATFR